MSKLAKCLLTSFTAWFAVFIMMWGPEAKDYVSPMLVQWLGDTTTDMFLRVVGLVVLALRTKTAMQLQMPSQ